MTRHEALAKIQYNKNSLLELECFINKIYDEFENKDKITKNDFVFTNCNDCKHKINGVFQEECISCKRYYGCHFEKNEI